MRDRLGCTDANRSAPHSTTNAGIHGIIFAGAGIRVTSGSAALYLDH